MTYMTIRLEISSLNYFYYKIQHITKTFSSFISNYIIQIKKQWRVSCKTWFYGRGNSIIFAMLNYHRDGGGARARDATARAVLSLWIIKPFIVPNAKKQTNMADDSYFENSTLYWEAFYCSFIMPALYLGDNWTFFLALWLFDSEWL